MKKAIMVCLLAISSNMGFSQKNNLEIGVGGYVFYNTISYGGEQYSMLNLKYSRSISPKINIFVKVSESPNRIFSSTWMLTMENTSFFLYDKSADGKILMRERYNYFDLGMYFHIYSYKNHSLGLDLASSYAVGKNMYQVEPYRDHLNNLHVSKIITEGYLGIMFGLKYDYSFWKNKMNAGAYFSGRNYEKEFPFQINYGLHLGYNF